MKRSDSVVRLSDAGISPIFDHPTQLTFVTRSRQSGDVVGGVARCREHSDVSDLLCGQAVVPPANDSLRIGVILPTLRDERVGDAKARVLAGVSFQEPFLLLRLDTRSLCEQTHLVETAQPFISAGNHIQTVVEVGSERILVDEVFFDVVGFVLRQSRTDYCVLEPSSRSEVFAQRTMEQERRACSGGRDMLLEPLEPVSGCDAVIRQSGIIVANNGVKIYSISLGHIT